MEGIQEDETNYAKYLYVKGFLPGPIKCSCGGTNFNIYKDSQYSTSQCSFKCLNNSCRKRYQIRINSLFNKFPYIRLDLISEIINCFLTLEFNVKRTKQYLENEKHRTISSNVLNKIYKELRTIIYDYMRIVYASEIFAPKNAHSFFAVDECLFSHKNGRQIWILGAINTQTKEFRLEATLDRSEATLKKFIMKYIEEGNTIITDGWAGYNFLNNNSSYNHITHIHGGGDFGFGIQSTSHIESLWAIIKAKIKATYKVIPNVNLMKFLKEAEFKYILKDKSVEEKISSIFESFQLIQNLSDVDFGRNEFYEDGDASSDEDNSNSDVE